MIRVSVVNNVTSDRYQSDFPDQDSATAWINACVAAKAWGKPDRWVAQQDLGLEGEDPSKAISTQASGGPDEEILMYHFACDYTITQTDVTAAAAQQAAIDKALSCQALGAQIIACVWAINEAKNISPTDFAAILADQNLLAIERLLWNGSLKTARAMIAAYTGTAFAPADIASVLAMIDNSGLV